MILPFAPQPAALFEGRPPARRVRRPLPPLDSRDWMTPAETAGMLGCSIATLHRMRRV